MKPSALSDAVTTLPGAGSLVVTGDRGRGVALFRDGKVIRAYTTDGTDLDQSRFEALMQGSGDVTLRWSRAGAIATTGPGRASAQRPPRMWWSGWASCGGG